MQFDLFFEISQPPFLQRSEQQAYADTLAEIDYADSLGFRCAWLVEHHFMRHYSHSSKPELLLAAAAQRTKNIRLGLGVVPLPYHHPVHVAERVATLDLLSNGRLEVGIGRGFSPDEYSAFGIDMADSRAMTNESLEILRLSFKRSPVTFHGKHFQLDNVDILPHPLQFPGPPLWSAAVSPDTFPRLAQENLGMLAGPFKPWFMVKQDISNYLEAWGGTTPPRIGMTVGIICLPDKKRAQLLAKQALTWFYHELLKTTLPVLEKLYPSYEHFHELGRFRELIKLGINLTVLETFGMIVVGDPAHCIKQLRKYEAAGVTHLLCAVGAGAVNTFIVQESMRCIAEEVMPAFRQAPGA
jgi:alkanesulfonate monooxygenase SsuD/methylene tetrahydromethanopterin reductase-like flavin-dependent oxidoreductase (luciferase family)